MKLQLNICCVHLFMLAKITKNELDLSLYSLNSKTSRYALFGHNRLTVYGIWLAAFMLPLRQKFKFQNIRYVAFHIWLAAFEIRNAACEIRIAVYTPKAYCPTTGLPFVRIRLAAFNSDRFCPTSSLPIFHIRLAACYSNCYSELFFKITV